MIILIGTGVLLAALATAMVSLQPKKVKVKAKRKSH